MVHPYILFPEQAASSSSHSFHLKSYSGSGYSGGVRMTHRDSGSFRYAPEDAGRALLWLLILCSVACVTPAKADDLIGNLNGGDNGVNSFSNTLGFANSFVIGGDSYLLSDIQIVMAGMPALSDPLFQLQS